MVECNMTQVDLITHTHTHTHTHNLFYSIQCDSDLYPLVVSDVNYYTTSCYDTESE